MGGAAAIDGTGRCLLIVLLWAFVQSAAAHVCLVEASIEGGARLATSPTAVELQFSDEVALASVTANRVDGDAVEVEFVPERKRRQRYRIALPDLEPGNSRIAWRALSADGHVVSGTIDFSVG